MTITEARDEIFGMLKVHWDLHAGDIFNPPAPIIWQGQVAKQPSNEYPFARATVLHGSAGQSTLNTPLSIRWKRNGVVIIQCFGPLSSARGLAIAEALATVAKDAYEGQASVGGIWFRNCRVNEVGPTADGWYQVNAIADFTYDEVK